ncbi:zinc metalloprotease HtpX [Calothrix sp. 336/3]|uniref:zinc metalloprotease HtpX n=1 Tax=Calothrix sp. 336/3 TaxID=1337936 RepID=UPI0004E4521C|nr:zinc metalloprotease HtpX [Calothrix sp. 336/3]AKG22457.1 Zn-dependent protease with chaperone function [Calothrix sp. 336/3]
MSSNLEPSLAAGIAALKQGDYQTARNILEAVVLKGEATSQAKIGLVVAYSRSGEIAKAIALSQELAASTDSQVKQWGERSLKQLRKRQNQDGAIAKAATGFVPLPESRVPSASDNSDLEIPPETTQPQSASDNSDLEITSETTQPQSIHWRNSGRAKVWQPLSKKGIIWLHLLTIATFIALFWVMRTLVMGMMGSINYLLVKLPFVEAIPLFSENPSSLIWVFLFLLTTFSPWLLERWFIKFYGQRTLDKETLTTHSKESVRVLQRYSQQRGWQFPKLAVLPLPVPLAITYGHLPRYARIVVSQGLLEQLTEEEIATIYATQLGHIANRDVVVMSLLLVITIPIYRLYLAVCDWGDRTSAKVWRSLLGVLGSLIYLVWCVFTGTSIWLSQLRLYYGDRVGADTTGNPNALARALLKISIGIAEDIQRQEQIPWQLETLNILNSVGYQQSLTLGSIIPHTTFESYLSWDYLNHYRWWLVFNNTHPLMGDRLHRLSKIARNWHHEPEIYLGKSQPTQNITSSFLLQVFPLLGIPCGILFAILIWCGWNFAFAIKILNLKWIYDNWSFMNGCVLIGFSIGILLRINHFFPEILPEQSQKAELLPTLLSHPLALPIDSTKVSINGKLLGRRGTANYLAQDLIIQSNTGLTKLHHISWLGQAVNPQDLIGRQVTVTGWLRRGATPWIDIQQVKIQSGKIVNSPHALWSTIVAIAAQAWGAYILLRGF